MFSYNHAWSFLILLTVQISECLKLTKQDKFLTDDELRNLEEKFRKKFSISDSEPLETFIESAHQTLRASDDDLPDEFYEDVENLARAFKNKSNHWNLFIAKQKRYSRQSKKEGEKFQIPKHFV